MGWFVLGGLVGVCGGFSVAVWAMSEALNDIGRLGATMLRSDNHEVATTGKRIARILKAESGP